MGFTSNKASLERLPGWEQESWAYHGDDGRTFFGETQGQGKLYGPKYSVNDTIGCGVNFSTNTSFFTRNGVFLGMDLSHFTYTFYANKYWYVLATRQLLTDCVFESGNAFRELRNVKLYPAVGVKKQPTTHLKANFGQFPFVYDIDGLMEVRLLLIFGNKYSLLEWSFDFPHLC